VIPVRRASRGLLSTVLLICGCVSVAPISGAGFGDGQVGRRTPAIVPFRTATTTDSYDLDGELTSSVNPRGQTITSGYDADGLVTGQSFPGGTTSFGYDAAGRQTTMTDGTGTTTTSYDAASEVTQVASPEGTIGYAYTKDGDRSSMTLPGSETVSYGYDAAGELTQLSDWLGDTVKIGYDQDGDRTSIAYPGGVTSTATYNPDQEQTGVTQTGPSGTIASDAYTYDAAGNQTRDVSLAGTTSYSYDALNRLTGASYPNGATQAFTYDAAGNRTSETQNGQTTPYTYNAAGELTAVGSTAYAYDAGGDVTQAGSTSYAWNAQGDLTSTTQGGSTTSYTYDADGVRASATTGSATTSYLTDTEASLPQVVSAGGTSYVSTLDGQAVEQVSGSTPQYLLSDALGSVTDVTSGSGSVAGTAAYDAYGDQTAQTGASSIFGFAGQQTDPTALQYLRARYLDPATGSFLSPDTVQPNAPGTQGNDLYSYAGDDPATATDPTGHFMATGGPATEYTELVGSIAGEVNTQILADALAEAEEQPTEGFIARCEIAIATGAPLASVCGPLALLVVALGGNLAIGQATGAPSHTTVQTIAGPMTLAQAATEATNRSSSNPEVAMDSSVLIAATQEGMGLEVDAALRARTPVVSPTAFAESTIKAGPGSLTSWMASHGARFGLPADPTLISALESLGVKGGNMGGDAGVAASAMEELLPVMTSDHGFFNALARVGYPVEGLP
jgi:RHS repeat-associated protein